MLEDVEMWFVFTLAVKQSCCHGKTRKLKDFCMEIQGLLLLHVKAPQALLPELGLNAMLALTTSVKIIL